MINGPIMSKRVEKRIVYEDNKLVSVVPGASELLTF